MSQEIQAQTISETHPRGRPVAPRGPVLVTRTAHFNAAHRLHNPNQSEDWNRETYGLCNNPLWHGHNYSLEVAVLGFPDGKTGYVIDLGVLKGIIERLIIDACDHRNLNEEVGFLKGVNPTAENLVVAFWNQLAPHIKGGRLYSIRLFETERNFVEYRGPGAFSIADT